MGAWRQGEAADDPGRQRVAEKGPQVDGLPGGQVLLHFLLLAAYLLPWAVLAYFLIKWREIANPN